MSNTFYSSIDILKHQLNSPAKVKWTDILIETYERNKRNVEQQQSSKCIACYVYRTRIRLGQYAHTTNERTSEHMLRAANNNSKYVRAVLFMALWI